MQPELALRASSHLLIVLLGIGLIALALVSMWKENRQGVPLKGAIWFALALVGICVFVLLAGYVQKIVVKSPSSYRGNVGIEQRVQGEVE